MWEMNRSFHIVTVNLGQLFWSRSAYAGLFVVEVVRITLNECSIRALTTYACLK